MLQVNERVLEERLERHALVRVPLEETMEEAAHPVRHVHAMWQLEETINGSKFTLGAL